MPPLGSSGLSPGPAASRRSPRSARRGSVRLSSCSAGTVPTRRVPLRLRRAGPSLRREAMTRRVRPTGKLDPQAIARWRYEQIREALGPMAHDVRGEIVTRLSSVPVRWPSGETRAVSRATVYRWIGAYDRGGLAALRPQSRKDRGRKRARLPKDVVRKARAILLEDPEISFTMLVPLLHADPELRLRERGISVSRSTLQRRLAADPLYARLSRVRHRARRRSRYVARAPHDIWHLDAKGPVTIRLRSRQTLTFHVLTVLDDASRATLASQVVPTPDLCAAVRVFRLAAERWGLPARVYADRASIFDAHAFRAGSAGLTVLMYGTREPNDICFYPRSGKVFLRGVGVIARLGEQLDYWDGED